jgi:hypothetical protein
MVKEMYKLYVLNEILDIKIHAINKLNNYISSQMSNNIQFVPGTITSCFSLLFKKHRSSWYVAINTLTVCNEFLLWYNDSKPYIKESLEMLKNQDNTHEWKCTNKYYNWINRSNKDLFNFITQLEDIQGINIDPAVLSIREDLEKELVLRINT